MKSDRLSSAPFAVAEAGVMVALAATLYMISFARLPYGGKLSLEMLPIFFVSFRRGWKVGILAGFALGIIILALDPMVVHPAQFILDYPLPHIFVGMSSLFSKNTAGAITLGGLGRFLCHFLSGIIFFGSFAPPEIPVWVYSLFYNGFYILPQLAAAMLIFPVLFKRLK